MLLKKSGFRFLVVLPSVQVCKSFVAPTQLVWHQIYKKSLNILSLYGFQLSMCRKGLADFYSVSKVVWNLGCSPVVVLVSVLMLKNANIRAATQLYAEHTFTMHRLRNAHSNIACWIILMSYELLHCLREKNTSATMINAKYPCKHTRLPEHTRRINATDVNCTNHCGNG